MPEHRSGVWGETYTTEITAGGDRNVFWYGFAQGLVQFFGGANQAASVDMGRQRARDFDFRENMEQTFKAEDGTVIRDSEIVENTSGNDLIAGVEPVEQPELESIEQGDKQPDENSPSLPSNHRSESTERNSHSHTETTTTPNRGAGSDEKGTDSAAINGPRTSEKEQPVILIPGIIKKEEVVDYELTYYLNDINTEHTQVLMEYGQNQTVKNSYIYGMERLAVIENQEIDNVNSVLHKEADTGYYLYGGRGSVSQVVSLQGAMLLITAMIRLVWSLMAAANGEISSAVMVNHIMPRQISST